MYHNLQVHNRRQQYGYPEPVVWKMYPPEPVVEFRKEVTTRGGIFRIRARGNFSVSIGDKPWNIKKYGGQSEIPLEAGTTTVTIRVANMETFPCIYVDGIIESDETWLADDLSQKRTDADGFMRENQGTGFSLTGRRWIKQGHCAENRFCTEKRWSAIIKFVK